MTQLEIILTSVTGILTCSNLIQVFYVRATRKKMQAEATHETDAVLYKRIAFLEERLTNLEELACYNKDCKKRI